MRCVHRASLFRRCVRWLKLNIMQEVFMTLMWIVYVKNAIILLYHGVSIARTYQICVDTHKEVMDFYYSRSGECDIK